jgi:hypothetical protein
VAIDKADPATGVERFPETKRRRFVSPNEQPQLAKAVDRESDEYVQHARSAGSFIQCPKLSAATKSSKRQPETRGGSDVLQLPYCYIRHSVELAVKPNNSWL